MPRGRPSGARSGTPAWSRARLQARETLDGVKTWRAWTEALQAWAEENERDLREVLRERRVR
jgi:hypothetical protein